MPRRGPARDNTAGRPTCDSWAVRGVEPLKAHRDASGEQNTSNAEDAVAVTLR